MFGPDFERRMVSGSTKTAARVAAVFLIVTTFAAIGSSGVRAVPLPAFVPVVATIWVCAEALTAVLLFGQYFVTGSIGIALFACAYELVALLTIPYVLTVPDAFLSTTPAIADAQPHVWLWTLWHLAFPILVVSGFAIDPLLKRARAGSPREVGASLIFVAIATLLGAVVIALGVWSLRSVLPIALDMGRATPFLRFGIAPLVAGVNGAACAYVLVTVRGKSAASLGIWISLALFSGMLEGIVGIFSQRTFSLAWYLAHVETTLTASLVLAMFLVEIGSMYARLTELATRDALTGLHNRRGLDDYLAWAFDYATRRELGLALMVIDIDHFKAYNDRYGHAKGDVALRRVASILQKSAVRRYDLCARYGGEEFVVALFNVGPHQAAAVAERLQQRVEAARIPHAAVASGHLSVSIGVGQVADATRASVEQLFAAADRALYRAKAEGRDRYELATIE